MKTTTTYFALIAAIVLSACAKAPMTDQKAQYQMNSTKILGSFASSVSRGFTGAATTSVKRGAFYDTYGNPTYGVDQWQQQNQQFGNPVLRQQTSQEARDCVQLSKGIPENCANLPFMLASLARCLDRIVSDRNPLYTYSYQNLDRQGQQYWSYLLDWRRARPLNQFGPNDFNQLSNYASSGYIGGDLLQ